MARSLDEQIRAKFHERIDRFSLNDRKSPYSYCNAVIEAVAEFLEEKEQEQLDREETEQVRLNSLFREITDSNDRTLP